MMRAPFPPPDPVCFRCGKRPEELPEYVEAAAQTSWGVDDYVRIEEGTYNPANSHFACTDCYVAIGMPSNPRGWIAP